MVLLQARQGASFSGNGATGKYLARLREEAGLKQKDVAQKVTWSPAVLSRVESGDRDITSDELDAILQAIGTEKALNFQQVARRTWKLLPRPGIGHLEESLLWETEQTLQAIEKALDDPNIKKSFANLLEELMMGLGEAARIVRNTEHSIAFVGDIGVGKSTAICRVSGLEITDGDKAETTPVLEVGGGGVTICEVHIVQGPGYGLLIEPMSESELRREVMEFAILLKDPPETASGQDDSSGQVIGTSKEVDRAIRNMSGLTKTIRREKDPDGKRRRVTEDPAEELANVVAGTSEFVVEILSRMNLERRTRRELWYPEATTDKEPMAWLKENFELINNGRYPDFLIPKRMEIFVPWPVLGEDSLSIRIIDTKGVDRTADRADIGRLLSEPSSVVVMCSPFNALPSPSVQRLLERAKAGRIEGVQHKAAVLGLPRFNEALAVKDDTGISANSDEDGYDLKRDQAETTMQSIGFPNLRVEFFNALRDEPHTFSTVLLDLVKGLRCQNRARLQEMIEDASSLVDNVEQQQTLEVQREAARHLKNWIESNKKLDLTTISSPGDSLLSEINRAHPSSVRASVRRQGDWYNLDYSHELSYGARLEAANVVGRKLNNLSDITDLFLNDAQLEEAFGLLRQARRLVNDGAEALFKKCEIEGRGIHNRDMEPSTNLWDTCDDEWGRGPGYRFRVYRHHKDWFNDDSRIYQTRIQNLIEREWKLILNRLLSIVEIS